MTKNMSVSDCYGVKADHGSLDNALRRLVDEKFASGNIIQVDRITITRAEYDAALAAQHDGKNTTPTYCDNDHFHKTASPAELGAWQRGWDECRKSNEAQDPVVESNRQALLERSNVGLLKYGIGLDRKDLDSLKWLQHLREELLDAVNYVEALKQHLERQGLEDRHVNTLTRAINRALDPDEKKDLQEVMCLLFDVKIDRRHES